MKANTKIKTGAALVLAALVVAGCATAPTGPTVMVYPGSGKTFDQFRFDERDCRDYAYNEIGGEHAAQAANNSAANSAVVGTAIGALAGAALGGHQGAAVGAGAGLLVGSSAGANAEARGSYSMQRRYDMSYLQCMYSKGNSVPSMARAAPPRRYYAPPPPPPDAPAPSYSPPPAPGSYSVPPPNTPPPRTSG